MNRNQKNSAETFEQNQPEQPDQVTDRKRTSRREPWSRKKKFVTTSIFLLLAHVVGALTSVHAVMGARSSQGAIAWAVSLNTFPYITVPVYWVFGQTKFDGYVTAMRTSIEESEQKLKDVHQYIQLNRLEVEENARSSMVERMTGLPYTNRNQVELLLDGAATFGAITTAIEAAQNYILFQFYIIRDDEVGQHFKRLLIEKARQGVKVYFLYDGLGSHDLSETYRKELLEAGVHVASFGHLYKGLGMFQINFRNHRKVVVVDGQLAFLGGLNVGNEYLGITDKFKDWRDTHISISGPAALEAQLSFMDDWKWSSDDWIELEWNQAPETVGDAIAMVVATGPADKFDTASKLILQSINSAQDRIWISSPYYVPDESVVSALELAALRGVDVRILLPDKSDSLLVSMAGYSYYEQSMPTGIRFYKYRDGFLHSKALMADNDFSVVTSANLDNRSLKLNFEIFALVQDKDFNQQMEQMFLADFARSIELESDVYSGQPIWKRFAIRMARLASPVL